MLFICLLFKMAITPSSRRKTLRPHGTADPFRVTWFERVRYGTENAWQDAALVQGLGKEEAIDKLPLTANSCC